MSDAPNTTGSEALIERVARALALAERYGTEADNDAQVSIRMKWWEREPDEDREQILDDGGSRWWPGRDSWRQLARVALAEAAGAPWIKVRNKVDG